MLVYGNNKSGRKVAVCDHLSAEELLFFLNVMLEMAVIKDILSAHLASGCTMIKDTTIKRSLDILKEREIKDSSHSLGQGVTKIAINVRTGNVSYEVTFTSQNASYNSIFLEVVRFLTLQIDLR